MLGAVAAIVIQISREEGGYREQQRNSDMKRSNQIVAFPYLLV